MANPISYNVHAQRLSGDARSALEQSLSKSPRSVLLVMDNDALAIEWAHKYPQMLVIARAWPDDDAQHKMPPEVFWMERSAVVNAAKTRPNLAVYVNNEPAFNAATLDWLIRVAEIAVVDGVKVVLGNFSVGVPEPLNAGGNTIALAEKLLRMMAQHDHLLILGLHEYSERCTWDSGRGWYMGRFAMWVDYCKTLGIAAPQIVFTEWGFGSLPGTTMADWKAGQGDCQSVWQTTDPQTFAADQLKTAWNTLYAPFSNVIGACLFCYGNSGAGGGTQDWSSYDWSGWKRTISLLDAFVPSAPVGTVTPPSTVWIGEKRLVLTGFTQLNMRSSATSSANNVIAVLQSGAVLTVSNTRKIASGYTWLKVRYGDQEGWIAETYPGVSLVDVDAQEQVQTTVTLDGVTFEITVRRS